MSSPHRLDIDTREFSARLGALDCDKLTLPRMLARFEHPRFEAMPAWLRPVCPCEGLGAPALIAAR